METKKIAILLKDLPNCPKGRIFKKDINGDYFHYMTDSECINNHFKSYKFTKNEIIENTNWFELKTMS